MGRRLFVGNLPYEVGEAELQELFGRVGPVESVTIVRDNATGRARGFGFVEMGTDEAAAQAITDLNQTQIGGRTIAVNEARPRPERSFGGGGFGGGRGGGFGRKGGGGGFGRKGGGGGRREPRW